MPTIYEPGTFTTVDGKKNFEGRTFADANALLVLYRDTLVAAGWTLVNDVLVVVDQLLAITLQGGDDGDNCYVTIQCDQTNSSTLEVSFIGDITGAGGGGDTSDISNITVTTNLSTTNNFPTTPVARLPFSFFAKANIGKLFISANESSFMAVIIEETLPSVPVYGGFPVRDEAFTADTGAWLLLQMDWRMTHKYVANALGKNWLQLKDCFYANNTTEPANLTNTSQGTYRNFLDPTVIIADPVTTVSATESGYNPTLGAIASDGKPRIAPVLFQIGSALQGSYAHLPAEASNAPILGILHFAAIGLMSLAAGKQANVTLDDCGVMKSRTYIGSRGHIGFLIHEEDVV